LKRTLEERLLKIMPRSSEDDRLYRSFNPKNEMLERSKNDKLIIP